jgi:protein-disulfide isomerase
MQKIHHYIKSITLTTPIAIIIGAIIISLGLMGYGLITKGSTPTSPSTMFKGKTIEKSDYVEGKENSKVVVIEYSDPECPYCISLSPTMKQLRTEYSDKVAFVYRHFPLSNHANAFGESKAIECAGILGGSQKYFAYIDALFEYKNSKQNQTNNWKRRFSCQSWVRQKIIFILLK